MKLSVWYELNLPTIEARTIEGTDAAPGQTLLDWTIEALREWDPLTDTFVISTIAGNQPYVYPRIKKEFPRKKIIPGIKSSHFLIDEAIFDTWNWLRFAEELVETASYTENKTVILENESAFWKINHGDLPLPNDETLAEGLQYLAMKKKLTYLWALPTILPGAVEETTTRFVRAIKQHVPNSKFVTAYSGWGPNWQTNRPDFVHAQHKMIGTVGARTIEKMYFVQTTPQWNGEGGVIWTPDDFWRYAKRQTKNCIVYPGRDLAKVGKIFREKNSSDRIGRRVPNAPKN